MRNAFAEELTHQAEWNDRIVLLSADIGNRLFNSFKDSYPDRFYNCGIAEANTLGVAAGLAMGGLRPFAYTIAPFITTRCLEQIKIDICYHHQPVVIVGVGSGLSYASLGATHHAFEDIAILRTLPNMTIVCPADPVEVRLAVRASLKWDGPVYIRLGKKGEPTVHQQPPEFTIGKSITLREGTDICLLCTGTMGTTGLTIAESLKQSDLSTRVESVHTIKPLDEDLLTHLSQSFQLVATIEEHGLIGGLGSAVAEWLVDHEKSTNTLLRFGMRDTFFHEALDKPCALKKHGLDPESIIAKIKQRLDI